MQNLKDKVAVVFAASGEIAATVALSFSRHGAKVYVTARNLDAVKQLAREINAGQTFRVDHLHRRRLTPLETFFLEPACTPVQINRTQSRFGT